MIYKAYNGYNKVVETANVKNKQVLREYILTSPYLHEIVYVKYGKNVYSMADIYGRM